MGHPIENILGFANESVLPGFHRILNTDFRIEPIEKAKSPYDKQVRKTIQ
jgi:hypothetical protein